MQYQKLRILYRVSQEIKKDFDAVTKDDFNRYIVWIQKAGFQPEERDARNIALKQILKFSAKKAA